MPASSARGLLGISVNTRDLSTLVSDSMRAIATRATPFTFACANPHSLVAARSDAEFREALSASTAVVADGVGVTFAGRLVGADVGPRITGTDFFCALMAQLNQRGGRVFFCGSSPQVLARVLARARKDYPSLHVDGLSPPYGEWSAQTNDTLVADIRAARADVLWVGMTAPKQEKWVRANLDQLEVPVVGSIGAVFDYYAGTVRRAPAWICSLGLEWLYRLLGEPRRLWRRTLISAPQFLWMVLREGKGRP